MPEPFSSTLLRQLQAYVASPDYESMFEDTFLADVAGGSIEAWRTLDTSERRWAMNDEAVLVALAQQPTSYFERLVEEGFLVQLPRKGRHYLGLEHVCASLGRTDALDVFARAGWNLDLPSDGRIEDGSGYPITFAAENGHRDTARFLFLAGARTDSAADHFLSAVARSGNVEMLEDVHIYGADTSPEIVHEALDYALRSRQAGPRMVGAVMDMGVDNAQAGNVLLYQFAGEDTRKLEVLLQKGFPIDTPDARGCIPLHFMMPEMDPEGVRLLKAYNVDVSVLNTQQQTALDCLLMRARDFHSDGTRYIDSSRMTPQARLLGVLDAYQTYGLPMESTLSQMHRNPKEIREILAPLGEAASHWMLRCTASEANIVLESAGAGYTAPLGKTDGPEGMDPPTVARALTTYTQDPRLATTPDLSGRTAMHAAAAISPEAMAHIRHLGGDIHTADHQGIQPIHVAAQALRPENILYALEEGADLHARDRHGQDSATYVLHGVRQMQLDTRTSFLEIGTDGLATLSVLSQQGLDLAQSHTAKGTKTLRDLQNILSEGAQTPQAYGQLFGSLRAIKQQAFDREQDRRRAELRAQLGVQHHSPAPFRSVERS